MTSADTSSYAPSRYRKGWLKYFSKGLGIFLIIAILFCIIALVFLKGKDRQDIFVEVFFILIACILYLIYFMLRTIAGLFYHRRFVKNRKMRRLGELGFIIENLGDYWGFEGVYSGYYFKIFYDWERNLYKDNMDGIISILAYYRPPATSQGKLHKELLQAFNLRYDDVHLYRGAPRSERGSGPRT